MTNKDNMIAEILKAMDDLRKSRLLEEIENQGNTDDQRPDKGRSGDSHSAEHT